MCFDVAWWRVSLRVTHLPASVTHPAPPHLPTYNPPQPPPGPRQDPAVHCHPVPPPEAVALPGPGGRAEGRRRVPLLAPRPVGERDQEVAELPPPLHRGACMSAGIGLTTQLGEPPGRDSLTTSFPLPHPQKGRRPAGQGHGEGRRRRANPHLRLLLPRRLPPPHHLLRDVRAISRGTFVFRVRHRS